MSLSELKLVKLPVKDNMINSTHEKLVIYSKVYQHMWQVFQTKDSICISIKQNFKAVPIYLILIWVPLHIHLATFLIIYAINMVP